jgi:hypothetical protein
MNLKTSGSPFLTVLAIALGTTFVIAALVLAILWQMPTRNPPGFEKLGDAAAYAIILLAVVLVLLAYRPVNRYLLGRKDIGRS